MDTFFEEITDEQREFIARQHMFFVSTAHAEGRINLSPKGMDTFHVIDSHTVAYLDLTGSGNETAAHLQHDGRITFMFCSFDQKPKILRIYGNGRPVRPHDPQWDDLFQHFTGITGQRQIILAIIASTQDSCGYAVPRYDFIEERQTLIKFTEKLSTEELKGMQRGQTASIDGLAIKT